MAAKAAPQAGSTNMRSSSAQSRGMGRRGERGEPSQCSQALGVANPCSQPAISRPICLTPPPSICLSAHPPFLYLSIHLFLYPSLDCLSVHLLVWPSISLSIDPPIHPSTIYLLTICLSIHQCVY